MQKRFNRFVFIVQITVEMCYVIGVTTRHEQEMKQGTPIFVRHPMIDSLREVMEQERLSLRHANFETGKIVVVVNGTESSMESIMQSVEFVGMIDRASIHAVDFKTGEITIEWHESDYKKAYGGVAVTEDEAAIIASGAFIKAIKAIRERTGFGLADAKNLAESARTELRRRGVMK